MQIAFVRQMCLNTLYLWEAISIYQRFINMFAFLIVTLFDNGGGIKGWFLHTKFTGKKLLSGAYLVPSQTSMMEWFPENSCWCLTGFQICLRVSDGFFNELADPDLQFYSKRDSSQAFPCDFLKLTNRCFGLWVFMFIWYSISNLFKIH